MKALFLLVLSLAVESTIAAQPRERGKRNAATIQNSFLGVQTSVQALESNARGLTPNLASARGLGPSAQAVESNMRNAQQSIASTQPISLAESPSVQQTADSLVGTIKIMVMTMILQKQTMDQLSITQTVLESLRNQQTLLGELGNATLSKVPPESLGQAQNSFAAASNSYSICIALLNGQAVAIAPVDPTQAVAVMPITPNSALQAFQVPGR